MGLKRYNPKVDYTNDKILAIMEEYPDGEYLTVDELVDWIRDHMQSAFGNGRQFWLDVLELRDELENHGP